MLAILAGKLKRKNIQASVWLTWPMLFPCKDSEIAPRRALRSQRKEFLIKKYSELCVLRVSVVNNFSY